MLPDSVQTLHDGIDVIAQSQPDAVALRCDDHMATFAQLQQHSVQAAFRLADHGLQSGDRVAIIGQDPRTDRVLPPIARRFQNPKIIRFCRFNPTKPQRESAQACAAQTLLGIPTPTGELNMSATNLLNLTPPHNTTVGAEIDQFDVRDLKPGSRDSAEVLDAIYRYRLVVFRNQQLNELQYIDFARALGTPQVYFQSNYHHPNHPEIFVSSNVVEDGQKVGVSGTGHYWHTDCAFEAKPLPLTSVYPQIFPEDSRGTMYTDMGDIYRRLPDHLRSYVDGIRAIHAGQLRYKVQASDIDKSLKDLLERINREVPPVKHPAVITHPATNESLLYLNSGFTVELEGLTHEENQRRLAELFEFIEQPEHIHTHLWRKGDLIVWDNRSLNHMSSAVNPGQHSKMYRIGIYDQLPFYVGIES